MIREFLFRKESNTIDVMACIFGALAMRDYDFMNGVLLAFSFAFVALALNFKWGFK